MHGAPPIACLLDLGKVLVRFDHGRTLRRLEEVSGIPAEELRPHVFGPLERELDLGRLGTSQFFRAVERSAGLARLADDVWVPAWRDIFQKDEDAASVLPRIRRGVRTCVVSNTNALHWDGVLRVWDVDRRVDALALSFEVGAVKPEPALFRAALAALDAEAPRAVFADDRSELVDAARRLGIDAFVVDGPGALADGLARRGLLADGPSAFAAGASPLFGRGVSDLTAGRFFEAHEEWEELWTRTEGEDRRFLQGLIQMAAACVHLEKGRTDPALRLSALALQKLEPFPASHGALPVAGFRAALRAAPRTAAERPDRLLAQLRP